MYQRPTHNHHTPLLLSCQVHPNVYQRPIHHHHNPLVRFMTPEDSSKLLEYVADLILDRYSRGYVDTLVRVRACL